jgi:hypothetical protein
MVRQVVQMHANGAQAKAEPCYPVAWALWHNDSSPISYMARLLLSFKKIIAAPLWCRHFRLFQFEELQHGCVKRDQDDSGQRSEIR